MLTLWAVPRLRSLCSCVMLLSQCRWQVRPTQCGAGYNNKLMFVEAKNGGFIAMADI